MHFRTKKMAVLKQLSQEAEFISLQELLEKLGEHYTERSVRRWLSDMVKEGLIEKSGLKRATKYKMIEQSDRHKGDSIGCFSSESLKVLEQINRPIYERNPVAYSDEWIDSYKPNKSFYIPEDRRSKLFEAGKRSKEEDPAGTYAHQIYNRLLIDLSYNSSRLEGNTYSLLDTQKLLLEGSSAEGKMDEEKIMILNHKEAIRYLVDTANRSEVSVETICTIHYLLADGLVEARYAGKIRDHGVRIGGSTYIPYEDQKKLQIQLDKITQKAALIEDPYEQSIFLLIHVSYLQAFTDVNKRTARLSANISLIKRNLVPLSFNDVGREDYSSAMIAAYELRNVKPMIDLYIFSYMRTCMLYDSTVKAIGYDEIRVRYRVQRRALIRDIILKKLIGIEKKKFLEAESKKLIIEKDRAAFLEDIEEDFKEIDSSRIVGLGISQDQLKTWINLMGSN